MNTGMGTFGRLVSVSLFAGILLATSCQNEAFLPPYQTDSESSILTSIRSGAVLAGSNSVQLSLEYDEAAEKQPSRLDITITDREGNSLGTQSIEGDQLFEPLPSVTPAEGREGLFILNLHLYDQNDELLVKKEIPFFKVARYPNIVQIEAYPPDSLHPESTGLLVPTVTGGEDLWVRWKMGSVLLEKGPLSEYREGYEWTAPASEGVYSITLEVFPEAPPEDDGDYAFQSPVKSEVQFYVQKRSGSRSGELGEQESYHTLLHLDGTFRDTGVRSAEFTPVGSPVLAVNDGLFGYYFSSADGVKSRKGDFLFQAPQAGEPFTFTLQFDPARGVQPDSHLFTAFGQGGESLVQLITDGLGSPVLRSPSNAQILHSFSGFSFEGVRELSISFLPSGDELLLKWYRNGRLIHAGLVPRGRFPQETWYGLQIGANAPEGTQTGFEGLFDEVGIYAFDEDGNPAFDSDIFNRWASRELGEREVLEAEGFEHIPADALRVDSGNPVLISEIKAGWAKAGLVIYQQDRGGLENFLLRISPAEQQENGKAVEIAADLIAEQGVLSLTFSRDAQALVVRSAEGREFYRTTRWGDRDLKVEMLTSSAASASNSDTAADKETAATKTSDQETTDQESTDTKTADKDRGGTEAGNKEPGGEAGEVALQISEVLVVRELSTFKESDI